LWTCCVLVWRVSGGWLDLLPARLAVFCPEAAVVRLRITEIVGAETDLSALY